MQVVLRTRDADDTDRTPMTATGYPGMPSMSKISIDAPSGTSFCVARNADLLEAALRTLPAMPRSFMLASHGNLLEYRSQGVGATNVSIFL